jgi:hypothetical protein
VVARRVGHSAFERVGAGPAGPAGAVLAVSGFAIRWETLDLRAFLVNRALL